MAQNINETPTYETAVPSLTTDDDVRGSVDPGDPNTGEANIPHLKLANRTKYLKGVVDGHTTNIGTLNLQTAALNAGKANKVNETHEGIHTFEGPIRRTFIPVPSSQARSIRGWELGFGLEDYVGAGIPAATSKNLIQAVGGVELLKYNETFALALTGSLIYHNSDSGAGVGYYYTALRGLMLPLSQDPGNPFTLVRMTLNFCTTDIKSRAFYFPNGSPGAEYLAGSLKVEALETALDGSGSDERAIVFGVYSDFAGGQNEAKFFIRNAHTVGKIDYLQGWLSVRACPNLIATV